MANAPAKAPCKSCPYRKDVPSGVWDPEEYAKLPDYDQDTAYQPPNMFACHQQDGTLCAGWVGCHDMEESLSVRLAVIGGTLSVEEYDTLLDYVSPVPLFESGQAAADHGLAEVAEPGEQAQKTIGRLTEKRRRKEASL